MRNQHLLQAYARFPSGDRRDRVHARHCDSHRAWEGTLRDEIHRNLEQKARLFANRVENEHTRSLPDVAAQEGAGRGRARHHHRCQRRRAGRLRGRPFDHGESRASSGIRGRARGPYRHRRAAQQNLGIPFIYAGGAHLRRRRSLCLSAHRSCRVFDSACIARCCSVPASRWW